MKGKYLLFGGSGFIGHHLTSLINANQSNAPLIFDIKTPILETKNFENIDVRDPIETKYIPSSNDLIFNLAAIHRTPGHPSNEYFETNLLGAENVCNYARKYNITTIVFTSSIATYGTYEEQKSEITIPMPDIPYGISKLTAEYIHKLWQNEDSRNRRLIILRPGVVFGQYEKGNFTRLVNAISKKRFFYPGRKDTIKACIYVKDLARTMLEMVNVENNGVNTYNMTYEPAPTIQEICEVISENGKLLKPGIIISPNILFLLSKIAYTLFKIKGLHPDRVKKLMISNDINGMKLNQKYSLSYGFREGLSDWFKETKFKDIIH
ncbi:NAD(P)-dependent oxidoreductase [Yeosuana marina]|uniref:NAD-dependent epimerase/dehydratase family protein n=1 Tax=Yeosuana marina TaxID=1565536 RepID=UPI0030ED2AAB|tara:strand:+ start:408 stop:1373 length:966 start_codon:yes stop_codon:yes gene_type:complete